MTTYRLLRRCQPFGTVLAFGAGLGGGDKTTPCAEAAVEAEGIADHRWYVADRDRLGASERKRDARVPLSTGPSGLSGPALPYR
jgi:hypothetical protein